MLELYHPDLLAYARETVRWQKEHNAQHIIKAINPVCGDKFEIRMDIGHVITNTSFFGYGCVVSKASIALLTDMIAGLDVQAARSVIQSFIDRLHDGTEIQSGEERFDPFMVARKFPSRMQCASLGWDALLRSQLFKNI